MSGPDRLAFNALGRVGSVSW